MKNRTQTFNSFKELATFMGVSTKEKKVNPQKLKAKQEKFLKCKKCGQSMTYVPNTNILVCNNDIVDDAGKVFKCGNKRILDTVGSAIADSLFAS